MGQEVECTASWRGETSIGRAYLGSDHVLFRGAFRLRIEFTEIVEIRSLDGTLTLRTSTDELSLILGRKSDNWLEAIRNPKSLMEKLEVKGPLRTALVGSLDDAFTRSVIEIAGKPDIGAENGPYDRIFFAVEAVPNLHDLSALRCQLVMGGMIWVIMRKGKEATVKDADLFPAAATAGLAVVKVAAFSETHTAQKLVARKASTRTEGRD